jgi:hypothetical protein
MLFVILSVMPNIIMPNIIMPNIIMPNIILPNVIMLSMCCGAFIYNFKQKTVSITELSLNNEYCYVECHIFCYSECHYAECHYAKCHYAECRGALIYNFKQKRVSITELSLSSEYCYVECHIFCYSECHYAECH